MTMALLQSVRNLSMFVRSIVSSLFLCFSLPIRRMPRLTPLSACDDNIVNANQLDFFASIHDPDDLGTSGFLGTFFTFCKKCRNFGPPFP
jgi:hypothetical protein